MERWNDEMVEEWNDKSFLNHRNIITLSSGNGGIMGLQEGAKGEAG